MSIIHPDYVFLNTELVDETWTLIKQDGIESEKIKEIALKASAKTKFGFGKIWQWLTTDLEMEVSGGLEKRSATKYTYTSFFRALMLSELIPDIHKDITDKDKLETIDSGTYMTFNCSDLFVLPIPNFADLMRLRLILQNNDSDEVADKNEYTLSLINSITSSPKALSLGLLLSVDDDNEFNIHHYVLEHLELEIMNVSFATKNDNLLLLIFNHSENKDILIISFVEEQFFKTHLSAYSNDRPIKVFGRKTYLKYTPKSRHILGINLISASLE